MWIFRYPLHSSANKQKNKERNFYATDSQKCLETYVRKQKIYVKIIAVKKTMLRTINSQRPESFYIDLLFFFYDIVSMQESQHQKEYFIYFKTK